MRNLFFPLMLAWLLIFVLATAKRDKQLKVPEKVFPEMKLKQEEELLPIPIPRVGPAIGPDGHPTDLPPGIND